MANASMLIWRVIKLSCDTMQAARLLGCLWSCAFLVCACVCVCGLCRVSHLDFGVNAAVQLQRTPGHRAQLGREMKHSWG